MIGKSLNQRYGVRTLLAAKAATDILEEVLAEQAPLIVKVRARGPEMIACLFVRADDASVRMCRNIGFELTPGGTAVLGLEGTGVVGAFPELPAPHRTWLVTPCAERETKVVVIADGGLGLLSLTTNDGRARIAAFEVAPD